MHEDRYYAIARVGRSPRRNRVTKAGAIASRKLQSRWLTRSRGDGDGGIAKARFHTRDNITIYRIFPRHHSLSWCTLYTRPIPRLIAVTLKMRYARDMSRAFRWTTAIINCWKLVACSLCLQFLSFILSHELAWKISYENVGSDWWINPMKKIV